MSCLNSLSFGVAHGYNEIPAEVLGLFSDLVTNGEKRIEFAAEIVLNGLQGRIDLNKSFNIEAYEATIRKNQKLSKEASRKTQVYIDFNSDSDFDAVAKSGGIREDDIAKSSSTVRAMRDAFEEYVDDESLAYAISSIKALNEELLIEERVDLIGAIKQAYRGIPSDISAVKSICENYSVVSDLVFEILNSGKDLEELLAE